MPAALTEPERAAWMRRHGRVLDPHLVVCQLRDGALILVLGRLLDRYVLVLRPTLCLRLQLLTPGGHRYLSLLVVWPGQVNGIRCGAPSNAWMVCGDGAQGALARFELVDRAPLGCLDDQHALQRARLQAELARPAYDGAGGIAIRHT